MGHGGRRHVGATRAPQLSSLGRRVPLLQRRQRAILRQCPHPGLCFCYFQSICLSGAISIPLRENHLLTTRRRTQWITQIRRYARGVPPHPRRHEDGPARRRQSLDSALSEPRASHHRHRGSCPVSHLHAAGWRPIDVRESMLMVYYRALWLLRRSAPRDTSSVLLRRAKASSASSWRACERSSTGGRLPGICRTRIPTIIAPPAWRNFSASNEAIV